MPRGAGLSLAVYLPRGLSQLDSLPPATREQRKMSCWEKRFLFCWADLSSGASNLQPCLGGDSQEEEDEGQGGCQHPPLPPNSTVSLLRGQPGYPARSTETSCAVTGMVLGYQRKGWWSPQAETTSCPSALAHAGFGDIE